MNTLAAYRQILEDLIRTAQGALELVESPTAMVSCSPEEILAFKRDHPNCTMIIGDFEIHCLEPGRYGIEPPERNDTPEDIGQLRQLAGNIRKSMSKEQKQAALNRLPQEIKYFTPCAP